MIQASTIEKTEWITNALNDSNLKAQLTMERFDDSNSEWLQIDDLDVEKGVQWGSSAKKYKYASLTLTPEASDIKFSVLNRNGKYSEGSGTSVSGIFDLDTKVRIRAGYLVPVDLVTTTETVFITGGSTATESKHFHTKFTNGELLIDKNNFIRNTQYFTDFFGLGTVQYNQNPIYTPTGMYIFTKDFEGNSFRKAKTITLTSDNSKYLIYYRSVPNLEASEGGQHTSIGWTFLGNTNGGTQTFNINEQYRYFQIALLPDGIGDWDSTEKVSELKFTYDTFIEYLYKNIYLLDSPVFTDPPSPQMPMVELSGRDTYKKAIESDVNLEDLSGGVAIDVLLKTLLDGVGIRYTASSITDLSSFSNRTLANGLGDSVKLEKIFEFIMQIISQDTDKYQMYIQYDDGLDDNIFFLQPKPTTHIADFVFNYRHYRGIGNYGKNYDKMLQRITIADKQINVDELVDLDTEVVSGAGDYSFSWSGSASFLEFEITTGSIDTGDIIFNTSQTSTSLDFTVTGTSPSFTIKVKGCKTNNTPVYGEFVHIENSLNRRGNTIKLINKLVLDATEYKKITKELMDDFANPVIQLNNLQFPYLHLMLQINDFTMNWARFVFNDDLSYLTGMKHNWNINQDSTSFNSDDSGLNFSDVSNFLYDESNGERYDIGFVYDMGISTTLSTDAEIDAASIITVNLECV